MPIVNCRWVLQTFKHFSQSTCSLTKIIGIGLLVLLLLLVFGVHGVFTAVMCARSRWGSRDNKFHLGLFFYFHFWFLDDVNFSSDFQFFIQACFNAVFISSKHSWFRIFWSLLEKSRCFSYLSILSQLNVNVCWNGNIYGQTDLLFIFLRC